MTQADATARTSDVKQLTALRNLLLSLHDNALITFFQQSIVIKPYSHFQGVSKKSATKIPICTVRH